MRCKTPELRESWDAETAWDKEPGRADKDFASRLGHLQDPPVLGPDPQRPPGPSLGALSARPMQCCCSPLPRPEPQHSYRLFRSLLTSQFLWLFPHAQCRQNPTAVRSSAPPSPSLVTVALRSSSPSLSCLSRPAQGKVRSASCPHLSQHLIGRRCKVHAGWTQVCKISQRGEPFPKKCLPKINN